MAVLGSAVTDSLTILLESTLGSQGRCLVASGAISTGAKQPGINPAEPAEVRAKLWQSIARVDLVIMLSSVEKSQEVLEEARQNGVQNKTWLIVDEATRAFYAFEKTQPGEVILVMTKDNPALFSELHEFNRYLMSEITQLRPSKTPICKFLSRWFRFIRDYPHNKRPSSVSLVSSANRVADVLSKVSRLRSTLDGILHPTTAPCESIFNATSEKIAQLRTKLKSSLTNERVFEQPYVNTTPSARSECNSEEFLLRRVRWSNAFGTQTFPRVGAWGNNCRWEINTSEIDALKKRQEVWKCPSGEPVKLPPYWDNCGQLACLTCPKNNRDPDWRKDSCRLCTGGKCSRIPIVYVSFSHPFALVVTCLCVLGEACVIFVVVVFAKYRTTPVVKSSNRTFNFFMLSTLGVWFAVTPMFLGRPGYLQCNTIVAAFLMLYATVSSILLSKTVRLLLIFKSMQQRPKWLGNASFFTTTIAFILIQALLCAMSYLIQPVQPEYAFRYDAVLLSCGRSSSLATALGFVYNCLLSGLCGFFAYKVRKLPQNFNEAKYISLGIFSYSLSWVIVLTGYFDENCLAKQTTVICLGFAVGGLAVLGCLFSPKVLTILFFPQLNTRSVTVEAARRYSIEASVSLGGIRSSRTRSSTLELPCSSSARIDFSPTNDNFLGVAARPRTQSDCSISRLVAERRCRFPSACSTDVTGSITTSSSESAVNTRQSLANHRPST